MSRGVYYNEWDPYAAAWLRNLIAAGHLPAGDVDERSITEVGADDLKGYTACHFFAGIGGWAHALRLAGWDDARPVWTGSCPCQPFSAAGKRKGVEDERHLWPEFRRLIAECGPAAVIGEQVASKDGRLWLAGVRADLEALGYAVGGADLCAAGVGAPHIRQRLWWVGQSYRAGSQPGQQAAAAMGYGRAAFAASDADGRLADSHQGQRGRLADGEGCQHDGTATGWQQGDGEPQSSGAGGGLGHADDARPQGRLGAVGAERAGERAAGAAGASERLGHADGAGREARHTVAVGNGARPKQLAEPGPHDFWSRAEWLACADGKSRRVKPGIFPLAAGLPVHLERVRAVETLGLEEIARHGAASNTDANEILRMVRDFVQPKASGQEQSVGVCEQLHAPEILLDFLLCVEAARDGIFNRSGFEKTSNEVRQRIVRGVRPHGEAGGPPCQRESDGQRADESTDALLALSLVLARHATAHRAAARDAHAASDRVGKLRAAGNAIVSQVAAEFIGAFLESQP